MVPPITDAIKAGITVVGEFTPIGTRYDTIEPQVQGLIFVGEAPVWNGKSLGELGVKACGNKNPCKVAYLEGFKALPLDNARTAAVKAALTSSPNVQIVASVEGGYTQATGLKAAQNVLQAHPDVNVMIGSSQAIEGATQAIKDAGLTGKVALIGNGGSTQAVAAVKDGSWFACYIIAEKSSGAKAAQLADGPFHCVDGLLSFALARSPSQAPVLIGLIGQLKQQYRAGLLDQRSPREVRDEIDLLHRPVVV